MCEEEAVRRSNLRMTLEKFIQARSKYSIRKNLQ